MFKRFLASIERVWARFFLFLQKKPTVSFIGLIIFLFAIIALGHFLRTPKVETNSSVPEKKQTALYTPRTDHPTLKTPVKVTKSGVVEIVSLSPGIVSQVYVSEGKRVFSGQTLLSLTNDYNSGRAGLEKALASNNAKLTEELAKIDKRIFELEEKKIKHDATLTDTEENIELKNLKKDRASRRATLANNPLELKLAYTNDAVLKPKTFTSGVIESIEVQPGDFVLAGQTLATLRSEKRLTSLEALISSNTAALFDPTQETLLELDSEKVALLPTYFSTQETTGGLYSIIYTLSPSLENKVVDGEHLSALLPLRAKSLESILIPLDAVFQESEQSIVLVEENGKAVSKTVTLGHAFGAFVEVVSGLNENDRIILNKAVIAGEEISAK